MINDDIVEAGTSITYRKQRTETGLYFFIIDGQVEIDGIELTRRDGLGLTDGKEVKITAFSQTELLCIEVPMN